VRPGGPQGRARALTPGQRRRRRRLDLKNGSIRQCRNPAGTAAASRASLPGRGTSRGTAWRIVPGHRVLPVLRAVSSMLLVRTVNEAVVMVRRRSTVRFRNGAPGRDSFSNDSHNRRGTSRERRSSALVADCTARARRKLLRAAAGGHSTAAPITVAPTARSEIHSHACRLCIRRDMRGATPCAAALMPDPMSDRAASVRSR
jgi:hypothetical protein